MGGGSDVKPDVTVMPSTKQFAQCSQKFSNHQFDVEAPTNESTTTIQPSQRISPHQTSLKATLFNDWHASISEALECSEVVVRVHVSQMKPSSPTNRQVCTTTTYTSTSYTIRPSKWEGNGEHNRLDVRFMKGGVHASD